MRYQLVSDYGAPGVGGHVSDASITVIRTVTAYGQVPIDVNVRSAVLWQSRPPGTRASRLQREVRALDLERSIAASAILQHAQDGSRRWGCGSSSTLL